MSQEGPGRGSNLRGLTPAQRLEAQREAQRSERERRELFARAQQQHIQRENRLLAHQRLTDQQIKEHQNALNERLKKSGIPLQPSQMKPNGQSYGERFLHQAQFDQTSLAVMMTVQNAISLGEMIFALSGFKLIMDLGNWENVAKHHPERVFDIERYPYPTGDDQASIEQRAQTEAALRERQIFRTIWLNGKPELDYKSGPILDPRMVCFEDCVMNGLMPRPDYSIGIRQVAINHAVAMIGTSPDELYKICNHIEAEQQKQNQRRNDHSEDAGIAGALRPNRPAASVS